MAAGALPAAQRGRFHSLVYTSAEVEAAQRPFDTREAFHDLFLDRIFDAAYGALAPRPRTSFERGTQDSDAEWRAEVHTLLGGLFATPASDVALARQRQEIARDLNDDDVARLMRDFQAAMALMREGLRRARQASNRIESQGWLLDAAQAYCQALEDLQAGLDAMAPPSTILCQLRADLAAYRSAANYLEMAGSVASLRHDLGQLRYAVRIEGDQVTVLHDPAAEDYSATVARTFARFRQADARDYRSQAEGRIPMDHVEARIVDRVALLDPELFTRLDRFKQRWEQFADPRWLRLDRELCFYLLWGDYIRRLLGAGVECCLPELVEVPGSIDVTAACDLALADQAARAHQTLVPNDFVLRGTERVIVVTGPNHGGKTTLARVFGQIHHVASLGLCVAARHARLAFPDRVLTHFERAEDITSQRGKLQEDLVRMKAIVQTASPRSVVVMNEVFSSTSLDDALWLGRRMMGTLRSIGCCCLLVTFLDELATFDQDTVSMVALVDPADPAVRTYKVVRRAADGRAYAQALAEKYRVTRAWLARRIAS